MKFTKSLLGVSLIALLSIGMVQAGEVLDSIMAKKKIVVATDANWPPQSFINDKNEMDGFELDADAQAFCDFTRNIDIKPIHFILVVNK